MPARAEPFLSDVLRAETAEAHARLEATLDLLAPPLQRERFVAVLSGFHGFHAVWEAAMLARPDCAALMQGRSRLALLRADLVALGLAEAAVDALTTCPDAAALCTDPSAARGSFYVMEGSTLGGQVIGRALVQTDWAPPEGLRYFTPYGPETGARWRAFKAWLNETPPDDWPRVVEGATATFDALRAWVG